ncbi:hypothetical protein [Thauera aromatica]|uniref:hypothetical protein n=1 Tax=Thauera aromatica TaxID=59405 RepID=UPI001FFCA7D1|nr:hypothetical protein [Thauera aromatica]MCK2097651.1 hypothetical protein [Thauera aromatica]
MKIEPKANCPLDAFAPCRQLDCAWFLKLRGANPNTGEEVDEWGCAVAWLPVLMVENSQQQRQTGAAVESFRNEMVRANATGQQVLLATLQQTAPQLKTIEVQPCN